MKARILVLLMILAIGLLAAINSIEEVGTTFIYWAYHLAIGLLYIDALVIAILMIVIINDFFTSKKRNQLH